MGVIWKKRFAQPLDPHIAHFLSSIRDDERLIPHDITATRAHLRMLKKQGLITSRDFTQLSTALKKVETGFARHTISLDEAHEDVHMNIEFQVKECIGQPADNLHMARSRNDLIATDMRLFVRQRVITLLELLNTVQKALLRHARMYREVVIPGYTHLQQAQPVSWAFYLLSIVAKLQRDSDRLVDAYKRINISPLGACALAGTAHRIDPEYTAALLGFYRFADNCMDAVSDRDFLCETACICAQIGGHLASFAEDMVLYASHEFALIELDDGIATGSSIMPHKKNPDILELLRARAASLIGYVVALFSVLKGLPGAYNRDHQDTKKIMFDCLDATSACLNIIPRIMTRVGLKKTEWGATPTFCCATNLVDYATTQRHTFRQAYHIVARCAHQAHGDLSCFIRLCAQRLSIGSEFIERLLTPRAAVKAKRSKNSTGINAVTRALKRAQLRIQQNERLIRRLQRSIK